MRPARRYPHPVPDDPLTLVPLTTARTEWQAEALAAALRQRGVHAVTQGGMLSGFRAEAPAQVIVVVPRQDLARAKEALAQIGSDSIDIDWDEVDVGQPEEAEEANTPEAGASRAEPPAGMGSLLWPILGLWGACLVLYVIFR